MAKLGEIQFWRYTVAQEEQFLVPTSQPASDCGGDSLLSRQKKGWARSETTQRKQQTTWSTQF